MEHLVQPENLDDLYNDPFILIAKNVNDPLDFTELARFDDFDDFIELVDSLLWRDAANVDMMASTYGHTDIKRLSRQDVFDLYTSMISPLSDVVIYF